jgi:predicted dehydrogenase
MPVTIIGRSDRPGDPRARVRSIAPMSSVDTSTRPIRAGLIGCGQWGSNVAAAVDRNQHLDLAAVADIDAVTASRLAAGLPSAPQVLTPAELLDQGGLDAVLIVTDAATHYELARAALTSSKHTFVEKPLAMSRVECADLVQLAASVDRTLMVGHTFLYSDYVAQVQRALDEGTLGELRYVHLQRLAYGRFRDDVNVVWNLGPHDVSILIHWARRPPQAVRCEEYAFSRQGLSDVAFMTLDFGGFLGHIQLSCVDPRKVRRATVAGTRAGIVYDDVAGEVGLTDNLAGTQRLLSSPGDHRPLDIEIDHFAECIVTGEHPKTDGMQGAWVAAILECATISANSGGSWVKVSAPIDVAAPSPRAPAEYRTRAARREFTEVLA